MNSEPNIRIIPADSQIQEASRTEFKKRMSSKLRMRINPADPKVQEASKAEFNKQMLKLVNEP